MDKERTGKEAITQEEFEKHYLYVRPEWMHEGAMEGVATYSRRDAE